MAINVSVNLKERGGIESIHVHGDNTAEVISAVATLQNSLVEKKDIPKEE